MGLAIIRTLLYVAIKIVGASDLLKESYAKREIDILKELNHPHVLKLIESFNFDDEKSMKKKCVLVMSFVNGLALDQLIKMRGALGLSICRLISRQLISAVSYLHGRAVIHRDIKPSNIILSRTNASVADEAFFPHSNVEELSKDNLIADDGVKGQEAVNDEQWKIVLVDFGFARALTPEEVYGTKEGIPQEDDDDDNKRKRRISKFDWSISNEGILEDMNIQNLERSFLLSEQTSTEHTATSSAPPQVSERSLLLSEHTSIEHTATSSTPAPPQVLTTRRKKMSFSRKLLAMSAIGTKAYAAPEIKYKARDKVDDDRQVTHEALTETVADYGMISDAYSVGMTIQEILTGVPADRNIDRYIAANTNPLLLLFCALLGQGRRNKKKKRQQRRYYRYLDELPKEAMDFVRSLTRADIYQRISVREAQRHAWIEGGVVNGETDKHVTPQGDVSSSEIP